MADQRQGRFINGIRAEGRGRRQTDNRINQQGRQGQNRQAANTHKRVNNTGHQQVSKQGGKNGKKNTHMISQGTEVTIVTEYDSNISQIPKITTHVQPSSLLFSSFAVHRFRR